VWLAEDLDTERGGQSWGGREKKKENFKQDLIRDYQEFHENDKQRQQTEVLRELQGERREGGETL